jgi:hypothetical protein
LLMPSFPRRHLPKPPACKAPCGPPCWARIGCSSWVRRQGQVEDSCTARRRRRRRIHGTLTEQVSSGKGGGEEAEVGSKTARSRCWSFGTREQRCKVAALRQWKGTRKLVQVKGCLLQP